MALSPIIVGAFRTDEEARSAIDALRNAGFAHEQLGFAWRESGAAVNNFRNDLMNLGVPQDQASYYDNELKSGRPIVSVRADGRDQEAMNILRTNGAYTYDMQRSYAQPGNYGQTSSYSQEPAGMAAQSGTGYGADEERRRRFQDEQQVEKQPGFNIPATREEVQVERRATGDQDTDVRRDEH
jgi:hypothetical protein